MKLALLALTLCTVVVLGITPAGAAVCSQSLQSLVDAAPAGSAVDVPACTYHENIQINHPLVLDGHGAAVIDGDNARERWVWINASSVTVRGFTMRNAATLSQQGALGTQAGLSGVVIADNVLGPTTNGFPIGVGGGTGTQVLRNDVSGGGQLGIASWQDQNVLIQGNHVHGNNTAGVDPGFAAGGMKVMNGSGRIVGNEVDHNAGPGIWIDIAEDGMTIANNNVHDQAYNPVFYEVSSHGDIYGNTVTNAPAGALNWGCIIASSSGDTNIHDNTCIDAPALLAILDNRADLPADAGRNVKIVNNKVVRVIPDPNQANPTEITRWWQWSPAGPLIVGQNGNVDSGNVALQSLATPTPVPKATPTVVCEIEVWLNGQSQGRKHC